LMDKACKNVHGGPCFTGGLHVFVRRRRRHRKTEITKKRMTNRRNLLTAIILVFLLTSLPAVPGGTGLGEEPGAPDAGGLYQRGSSITEGDYKKRSRPSHAAENTP